MKRTVHALIIAGGNGTRFWPLSRKVCPKQFLPITGTRPMLQETVTRVGSVVPWNQIWIATVASQADKVRELCPDLPPQNIIIEPIGRNTGPCIGFAAHIISKKDPEGVMLVLPADHYIQDEEEFIRVIGAGVCLAAENDRLITIGIKPTHPETAYGYLEIGANLSGKEELPVHHVERFHEKPDYGTAEKYCRSDKFFWNSGIFIWRIRTILRHLECQLPDVGIVLREMMEYFGSDRFAEVVELKYPSLRSVSIDFGVMEHTDGIWMIQANFGWSDVGSWPAAAAFWPNRDGNAVKGRIIASDSTRCTVYSPKRLVALLGVDDLVVVDTPDALLICTRERAQDVRQIVTRLEEEGNWGVL